MVAPYNFGNRANEKTCNLCLWDGAENHWDAYVAKGGPERHMMELPDQNSYHEDMQAGGRDSGYEEDHGQDVDESQAEEEESLA